jgi:mannose-1-phosphate guanylyltransferase
MLQWFQFSMGWSDIGSWGAMYELGELDGSGNLLNAFSMCGELGAA